MKKNEKRLKELTILSEIENKINKYLKKHIDGEKLIKGKEYVGNNLSIEGE